MRVSSLVFRARRKSGWIGARLRARICALSTPGLKVTGRSAFERGVQITIEPGGQIDVHNTYVRRYATIEAGPHATIVMTDALIGRFSSVSARCRVTIGSRTQIAAWASVRDHNHRWSPEAGIDPLKWTCSAISIGTACWIGDRVSIMPGVTMGDNAIAGAGSIVTKSIPKGVIVGGVPAKPLRRSGGPRE